MKSRCTKRHCKYLIARVILLIGATMPVIIYLTIPNPMLM